jgi:hypothetical protein
MISEIRRGVPAQLRLGRGYSVLSSGAPAPATGSRLESHDGRVAFGLTDDTLNTLTLSLG